MIGNIYPFRAKRPKDLRKWLNDFIYSDGHGATKTNETHVNVGESKQMEAMSLKKLQRKLDPKKKYHIEYRNKKNNYISRTIEGRDNG